MALQKGTCKNFGECDLADNKEIQEVEKSNFICEECGKPLHPLENVKGRSGGTGSKGTNWKIIGGVIACVVVLGVVIKGTWGGSSPGSGPDGSGGDTTQIDSTQIAKGGSDSTQTAKGDPIKQDGGKKTGEKPKHPVPPEPSPIKVPFGTYSGPPNGQGGTIKVTRSYPLSLNDNEEPIELSPGDEIQLTKFTRGELSGGVWVHHGSRRFFTR